MHATDVHSSMCIETHAHTYTHTKLIMNQTCMQNFRAIATCSSLGHKESRKFNGSQHCSPKISSDYQVQPVGSIVSFKAVRWSHFDSSSPVQHITFAILLHAYDSSIVVQPLRQLTASSFKEARHVAALWLAPCAPQSP